MWCLPPSCWRRWRKPNGFTLLEVLVGVAITVTVITTAVAVLSSLLASQRRMLQQTEQAESLRIAAAWITRDARLSQACGKTISPIVSLQLGKATPTDYVVYKFYGRDENGAEVFDPDHLHRWEYQGGNLISEEIVGWNMDANNTTFNCVGTGRMAEVALMATPSPGQSMPLSVTVQAMLRTN